MSSSNNNFLVNISCLYRNKSIIYVVALTLILLLMFSSYPVMTPSWSTPTAPDEQRPPLTCDDPSIAPHVTINSPAEQEMITDSGNFRLSGSIVSGHQIQSIILTVVHQPPTEPAQRNNYDLMAFTLRDLSSGGNFDMPMGGIFYPQTEAGVDRYQLTLTMTDVCGVSSSSDTVTISYQEALTSSSQLPEGTRVRVLGTEVTQAIQDLRNSVPLVEGKRTVVRVFPTLTYSGSISNLPQFVTGELEVRRVSSLSDSSTGVLLGRIPSSNSLDPITQNTPTVTPNMRSELGNSLNFWLPPEWTREGFVRLSFKIIAPYELSQVPCDGCTASTNVQFVYAYPMRIQILSFPYTVTVPTPTGSGSLSVPIAVGQDHIDMLKSWLRRAFPTNIIFYSQVTYNSPYPGIVVTTTSSMGLTSRTLSQPNCVQIDTLLVQLHNLNTGMNRNWDVRIRMYGIVSDASPGAFMRGCSPSSPSLVGSGPTGPGSYGWDFDGSYGDWYGAHEIGHIYGREHPGFPCPTCNNGQTQDDRIYPYANGLISGPDQRYFGFDVGDGSISTSAQPNGIVPRIYPPSVWTDVMTYLSNEWISDYTYRGILAPFLPSNRAIPSGGGGFVLGSAPASGAGDESPSTDNATATTELSTTANRTLFIVGNINLNSSAVRLEPFMTLPGLHAVTPKSNSSNSPFRIDLLDAAGNSLASFPFEPKQYTDLPQQEDKIALISENVPYVEGTAQIQISKDGQALASRIVTDNPPEIEGISINVQLDGNSDADAGQGNSSEKGRVDLGWKASDPDGGNLTYSILYSYDNGNTWQAIAANITDPLLTVNLVDLPGSENQSLFRIIATDGVNTVFEDLEEPFSVSSKPPIAKIISPFNNSIYGTNQTVIFDSQVSDLEDIDILNESQLEWSSAKNGILGYGRSISANNLEIGMHAITLTVTDSNGQKSSDTIMMTIMPGLVFKEDSLNTKE